MGWFLLRKPYPGLTEEETIDILPTEMIVGRGRECTIHCLSMYVSRRHLKITTKSDGCVYIMDLGSSNGTFINQTKITPRLEVSLTVGDEIGIGNINVDNKDCYVYEVCCPGSENPSKAERKDTEENPEVEKNEESRTSPKPNTATRQHLERGLKRFADDDIIILDDDDDHNNGSKNGGSAQESVPTLPKKAKMNELVERRKSVEEFEKRNFQSNCITLEPEVNNQASSSHNLLAQDDPMKGLTKKDPLDCITLEPEVNNQASSSHIILAQDDPMKGLSRKDPLDDKKKLLDRHNYINTSNNLDGDSGAQKCEIILPPPPAPIPVHSKAQRRSFEESLQKPTNRRLSSLLEDTTDTSAGTIKVSSPDSKFLSTTCSTPTVSKQSVLTSTPCVGKFENGSTLTRSGADFSPIVKDSPRQSRDSSANYTLEEEMIELSDDDEEIFPCSQMFAEEDVKPNIEDLNKEADLVDLVHDEEPEANKSRDEDDELDDVVLISSDDEDEDDLEDANRWLRRLSQSSVKVELEDEVDAHNTDQVEKFSLGDSLSRRDEDDNGVDKFWDYNLEFEELEREVKEQDTGQRSSTDLGKRPDEDTGKPDIDSKLVEFVKEDKKHHAGGVEADKIRSEKKRDKKKDKRDKDKSKEKTTHDRHKKRKDDGSHKHVKSEKKREAKDDKHGHRKHSSKKKDSDDKGLQQKLKNTSHQDEPTFIHTEKRRHSSDPPYEELEKTSKGLSPNRNDSDKRNDSDCSIERELRVHLKRIEDQPELCSDLNLPLTDTSNSTHRPPAQKKSARKTEYVEALPQPQRRAFNRGISSNTALKMFHTDKPKSSRDDSKTFKSVEIKDPKALRKEKLAKVAAQNTSREREANSESKRAAPAKIKVTKSNRGSFLTCDEDSPANKPRSRKDIVGSMKIPKLKDKPATDLPTKSPLQAMNMSWEKDKDNPPPSAHTSTPSEPVEIPTGPQPKKRIAQVPPPGFYCDVNGKMVLGPTPTSSTSCTATSTASTSMRTTSTTAISSQIKSCLSGSSKHNISLNDLKPAPAKKRVRFKENIVEVRYIEKCPNARPLSSMKDADRPTQQAMSQVNTPIAPRNSVMPNEEFVLQDVLYDISKWNPLWLKEEKNLPPDVLPPVVSNMNLPVLPKTEFLDFEEYHDTMYPLLMLELWNGVSKEYNSRQGDLRANMIMAVDSATSSPVYSRPDRMITTLNCHMLVDERGGGDAPRLGYLVVIDLALKDPSGKLVVNPVFGYVSFDTKDRLNKHDQFHKDLFTHCRNPFFKIRFSLLIRERKNFTFVLEKPMRVKNVKYIRGDLRVFQAVKNLNYMPLKYSVISPSAANEDFTLPDISTKTLAFAEQLNPTQEQVVLQTAEVCQQDKPKICLIQGPPGTGKSHVIASLVVQLLYRDAIYTRQNREKGLVPRILLCAPSNNAVDSLVRRLLRRRAVLEKHLRFKMVRVGQIQNMHPEVKGVSLQELAKTDVARQDQAANALFNINQEKANWAAKLCSVENVMEQLNMNNKTIPQELLFRQADFTRRLKVLEERSKQQSQAPQGSSKQNAAMEREASKKILRGADIVATTLNSCVIKTMENVFPPTSYSEGRYHFQVCIVDEATQCLEVETLIPLLLGVKTLVLVGDPNQLPATIMSKVAREKGLGTSLFARLQKTIPDAVQLLDMQYRMHPEILRWPNKFFYNRRLKTPDHLTSCRDSRILPYTVISLPFQQDPRGEVNHDEARFVLQLADLLIEKKAIPQQDFRMGIVTPYQSQRSVINKMLQDRMYRETLEVNTIDSYQGQERDVILMSCVRTNGIGFLSDRQRINVALTRAKYALFICGNFSSLDRDPMWNNLLTDARQRKCFLDLRDQIIHNNEELWNLIRKK